MAYRYTSKEYQNYCNLLGNESLCSVAENETLDLYASDFASIHLHSMDEQAGSCAASIAECEIYGKS